MKHFYLVALIIVIGLSFGYTANAAFAPASVPAGGTGLTSATAGYFLVGNSTTALQATSTIFILPTGQIGVGTLTPTVVNANAKVTVAGTGSQDYIASTTDNTTLSDAIYNAYAPGSRVFIGAHGTNQVSTQYGITVGGYGEFAAIDSSFGTSNGLLIGTRTTAKPIIFGTNSLERVRIDSTGNVGIGSTSPTKLLSIGTNNIGSFAIATSTVGCATFASGGELYSTGVACGTGSGGGSSFGQAFEIDALKWLSSTTTGTYGINANAAGTTYGYGIGGSLLGYASSTNQTTIFGLRAGGQNATTSATALANTFIGYQAGNANTSGSQNTFIGKDAGLSVTTGSQNTAIGNGALSRATIAPSGNTIIGQSAGLNVANGGNYNVLLGYLSGDSLTSGVGNITLGTGADVPVAAGSGQLNIGNVLFGTGLLTSGVLSATPKSNAALGIGTTTPYFPLAIASSTAPQLALLDGSSTATPWTFRSINNNLYVATSSPSTFATSTLPALTINSNGYVGVATSSPMGTFSVVGNESHWGTTYHYGNSAVNDVTYEGNGIPSDTAQTFAYSGNDNTTLGAAFEVSNVSTGTHAYTGFFMANDQVNNGKGGGLLYAGTDLNGHSYSDTAFGTAFAVPDLLALQTNLGPISIAAASSTGVSYINFFTGGSDATNERMRIVSGGNIGIGTTTPGTLLDVNGGLRSIVQATSTCNAAVAGLQFYNAANDEYWGCTKNGTYTQFGAGTVSGGGGGTPGGSSGQLQFNSSSAFAGGANLNWDTRGMLGIGTSTPQFLLNLATSSAQQLVLSDGSATSAGWAFRNAGGNFYLGTTSPSTFATSTEALSISAAGIFTIGSSTIADFTHDQNTSSTTVANLVIGNQQTDSGAGYLNLLDMPQLSNPAAGTVEAGCLFFCSTGANASTTLTAWGLATGAGGIKNFAVSIGTSTAPNTGGVAGGTDFQVSGNATTTFSVVTQQNALGGRIILKDVTGNTCTEVTSAAGVLTSKAVACPTN